VSDEREPEIVVEPGPRYAEYILSLIPPCPKYVKRRQLIEALASAFKLSKKRAESIVTAALSRWLQSGMVKRAKVMGYYCVDA
jgi:hypothetical protein